MSKSADKTDMLRSGWRSRNQKETVGARDKMQASLLDRLTDHHPEKKKEAPNSTLISHSTLRRHVLRDLQWLFNTVNHENPYLDEKLDYVRRSVLNFGVTPLAGQRMSDIEWQDVQSKLTEAILSFEPRILPEGLHVKCVSDMRALDLHNILSIEIRGRLWCVPYPLEFLFRTDIDLENGHFELKDAG